MRPKPIIGVPADRRVIDPHPFHMVGEKYLKAVIEAAEKGEARDYADRLAASLDPSAQLTGAVNTLVPCEGQHIRWEFMLRPDDDPASLEREETARAMMAPHLHRLNPAIRPEDGVLLRSKVYTFHGLVGERFQSGRIFPSRRCRLEVSSR